MRASDPATVRAGFLGMGRACGWRHTGSPTRQLPALSETRVPHSPAAAAAPRPFGLAFAAVTLVLAAAAGAQTTPAPSDATVASHVAAATQAAGSDLKGLMSLCTPAPATRPSASASAGVNRVAVEIARPAPPPGMAFDNLAYVGGRWSGAWALQTSEGTILLDALNNAAEAKALIEGGMLKLGLDPAKLKMIVVSHAHGDHYGGAPYLIERFGSKMVMSEAD